MRRGRGPGYTLWTDRGMGSYRSWGRALGAARWTAAETGALVAMASERGGTIWDVTPDGQVSRRPV